MTMEPYRDSTSPPRDSGCKYCGSSECGLHDEWCPHIGIRLGGGDDAVHIIATEGDYRTLCDLYAPSRNTRLLPESDAIGGGSGCWTCLTERDRARHPKETP
jgi:hypothetical protein